MNKLQQWLQAIAKAQEDLARLQKALEAREDGEPPDFARDWSACNMPFGVCHLLAEMEHSYPIVSILGERLSDEQSIVYPGDGSDAITAGTVQDISAADEGQHD